MPPDSQLVRCCINVKRNPRYAGVVVFVSSIDLYNLKTKIRFVRGYATLFVIGVHGNFFTRFGGVNFLAFLEIENLRLYGVL